MHFSGKKKKNLPFSSCKEALSKCFLAVDDKSTACNTFLQLISGKKPDVTAIQFVKPIGVLRFWLSFFFLLLQRWRESALSLALSI